MRGFTHEGRVKKHHRDLGYYDTEESDINLPVPSDFQLLLNLTFIVLYYVIFDEICLSKGVFFIFYSILCYIYKYTLDVIVTFNQCGNNICHPEITEKLCQLMFIRD
jgi:hypothetical protein